MNSQESVDAFETSQEESIRMEVPLIKKDNFQAYLSRFDNQFNNRQSMQADSQNFEFKKEFIDLLMEKQDQKLASFGAQFEKNKSQSQSKNEIMIQSALNGSSINQNQINTSFDFTGIISSEENPNTQMRNKQFVGTYWDLCDLNNRFRFKHKRFNNRSKNWNKFGQNKNQYRDNRYYRGNNNQAWNKGYDYKRGFRPDNSKFYEFKGYNNRQYCDGQFGDRNGEFANYNRYNNGRGRYRGRGGFNNFGNRDYNTNISFGSKNGFDSKVQYSSKSDFDSTTLSNDKKSCDFSGLSSKKGFHIESRNNREDQFYKSISKNANKLIENLSEDLVDDDENLKKFNTPFIMQNQKTNINKFPTEKITETQKPQGIVCQPSCSIWFKKVKIEISLKPIMDYEGIDIVLIPYSSIKLLEYPGFLVNKCETDYRARIESHQTNIGKAYFQACNGINNFRAFAFVCVNLKVNQQGDKTFEEDFLSGVREVIQMSHKLVANPKIKTLLIPYDPSYGDASKIIKEIQQSLTEFESIIAPYDKVVIAMENGSHYTLMIEGYKTLIDELVDNNQL